MTKYNLEFKGLKEGLHEFEYEIDNEFFEHFDQEFVSVGTLLVKVKLEKRSTFLKLSFSIKGWVELTCDRCLEQYRQAIIHKDEIFVKFSDNVDQSDDKIIWVLTGEHSVNIARLIYEYIVISIPLKRVHPDNKKGESGCNREMIRKLEEYSWQVQEKVETDQRWDVLKSIRSNK
ncbi:MAG: DUF177 domain-containing protein [Prolixibacteraceae bacterium]|nr:DUF177 domain-containing protein [Prolixibacteraceae bacterium]